jgi:hypothetical protein
LPDDFLFVKGVDVGSKRDRRISDPSVITGVENGAILFIKGTDVEKRSPSST